MKNNNGFTLVEILVTVGLIGVITLMSSDFILNLVSSSIKIQNADTVEQNYTFTTTKLVKMIEEADSVSVINANTILIVLNSISYNVEVKNGGIYLNNELISDSKVSVSQSLSSSNTDIFTSISASNPVQVKIRLLFSIDSGLGPRYSASSEFERIVTVRKSY